jgi:predicted HNH restriction endonuclease
MPKKQIRTPKSQIRNALRMLFLRSRERAATVKRDKNTCQMCGKKGSVARGHELKIEVHHLNAISWDKIIDYIQKTLLCDSSELICYCKDCHKIITEEEKIRSK